MKQLKKLLPWILAVVVIGGGAAIAAGNDGDGDGIVVGQINSAEIKDETIKDQDLSQGVKGQLGKISDYQIFTSTQDFGPGGIGGAWCGAPNANTTDQDWIVLGGGAELTSEDVDKGFAIAGSWPHEDPLNPGWSIQLNKPANQDPGNVELYVVCAKEPQSP